jgi:hypothetical protein
MAVAKSILEVVIQGVDKLSGPTRKAGESVADFEKRTKKQSANLKQMGTAALKATATIAALGFAAKKAFDLGKEGAAIQQTGQSFGFLMSKVGASADTLDQLRAASQGTITDMDLMSSTATLLAGAQGELGQALGDATPQLMRIAKAAQALNPSLGTTTQQYNSLALGIKRGSPLILDNLGLLVSVKDANQRFAASIGKTTAELTSEEQKMALLNETIRAGNVLIDQAGGTTDSATDNYNQLSAATENLTNVYKVMLHEALNPTIGRLAEKAQAALSVTSAIKALQDAHEKGTITQQQFAATMSQLRTGVIDTDEALRQLTRAEQDVARETSDLTEKLENANASLHSFKGATFTSKRPVAELAEVTGWLRINMEKFAETTEATKVIAADYATMLRNQLSVAVGDTTREIIEKKARMEEIEQTYDANTIGAKYLTQEYMNLGLEVQRLVAIQNTQLMTGHQLLELDAKMAGGADRRHLIMAGLIDTTVTHTEKITQETEATDEWTRYNDRLALALGTTTQEIINEERELERLRAEVNDGTRAVELNERQMIALEVSIRNSKNEMRDSTRVVKDNTAAFAERALELARNTELSDAYRLMTGKATEEILAMEKQLKAATDAYIEHGEASGFDAMMIGNMRVQLDLATDILRDNESAIKSNKSALDSYSVSARKAWEASQMAGTKGPGMIGGPPPGEYEGEGGAERFAQEQGWQVSARGRTQEQHAKDVLASVVAGQSGVWESGGDMSGWVKEFMMSGAGTGLAAGFDESTVNAAIKDFELAHANAAQGLSGIVPGGFPNDSFLIGATSGERVNITPAHKIGNGGGGIIINSVNVMGVQTESQLYDAVVRAARQRGRAFAKVM